MVSRSKDAGEEILKLSGEMEIFPVEEVCGGNDVIALSVVLLRIEFPVCCTFNGIVGVFDPTAVGVVSAAGVSAPPKTGSGLANKINANEYF